MGLMYANHVKVDSYGQLMAYTGSYYSDNSPDILDNGYKESILQNRVLLLSQIMTAKIAIL